VIKLKICCAPGCNAAIPRGTPRCPQHAKGAGRSGWSRSPSGRQDKPRLAGSKWRKLRERVLRRDMYCCQQCARDGRIRSGNECDHIDNNGDDSMGNLQTLCSGCHNIKTQAEARAGRELS
jgi:5-methylcytosine-specific restriction protein A